MKKIAVVFERDRESGKLADNVRPGMEWVVRGEGTATIKFDGTSCRWHEGRLWKRFDRKLNRAAQNRLDAGHMLDASDESLFRTPPGEFEPCEPSPDPVSFHWPGWVPVSETDPADKWHREALLHSGELEDGTYELVGPALADNPYGLTRHELWKHGREVVHLPDCSFEALRAFLSEHYIEGLVFHHPDGRMAKLRRKDFDLFWVKEDLRKPKRPRR